MTGNTIGPADTSPATRVTILAVAFRTVVARACGRGVVVEEAALSVAGILALDHDGVADKEAPEFQFSDVRMYLYTIRYS
jgi:hypothetical protein